MAKRIMMKVADDAPEGVAEVKALPAKKIKTRHFASITRGCSSRLIPD
jgi:hypothetical protein